VIKKEMDPLGIHLPYFPSVAVGAAFFAASMLSAQAPKQANVLPSSDVPIRALGEDAPSFPDRAVHSPLADPKAIVSLGNARFTVLTPALIRMEWSADGRFEDSPSPVFINRRLPVPRFHRKLSDDGQTLTIRTNALVLVYNAGGSPDGRFTSDSLTVNLSAGNSIVVWRPGKVDERNLPDLNRAFDRGSVQPVDVALFSSKGWTLVDDTCRSLVDRAGLSFNNNGKDPGNGSIGLPACDRTDWYFFGFGHDYKRGLGDYTLVAGRVPPGRTSESDGEPGSESH
jgi:alpha-glucosidase